MNPHIRFLRAMAILMFLALIPLTTCGKDSPTKPQAPEPTPPAPPPPAPVATRVEISPSSATLTSVGQTVQLSASVFDQNNAQMSSAVVTWSSSAVGVATVSGQGLVTAVKNGTATITGRSGNASASIPVTVMQSVGSITIEPTSATLMALGETVQLTAAVLDQNGQSVADAAVSWSSSDAGVATVSTQGLVTAVKNGTATITGRSGNASATSTVTVMQSAGSVAIEPSTATLMSLGETVQLTATVLDQNGQSVADAAVSWSSSDEAVATVSGQGLVRAVKNGSATITARSGTASTSIVVTVSAMEDSRDRDALIALYNATNGPGWGRSDNWLSDAPLNAWYGVFTDSDGRVVGLSLHSNNLQGTIPAEIGKLNRLATVHLGYNGLQGTIPPELGSLAQLTQIYLENNALSGLIPPELGGLKRLDVLNLRANSLTGPIPPELGNLTALARLRLAYNGLSGPIPSELGNLESLLYLSLFENQLTGPIPPELGKLARLQVLSLDNNQLNGSIPPELAELDQLTALRLGFNQMTGSLPPWLDNLSELKNLYLPGNALTGPIPPEIGKLVNLKDLSLHSNQLSGPIPPELGNLAQLEQLHLSSNRLSGIVPPELGNLGNLIRLDLQRNLLEGTIPLSFLRLNRLQVFGCSRTSGVCLPATDKFRDWARQVEARGNVDIPIDIPYCDEIDRRGLAALYASTNGDGWTFSNGWLDDDESLGRWYGVRTDAVGRVSSLDLRGNKLSGSVPDAMGLLQNLKELRIGNNALTGRLPLSLSAVPLDEFDYTDTSLCIADDTVFPELAGRNSTSHRHGSPVSSSFRTRDPLITVLEH